MDQKTIDELLANAGYNGYDMVSLGVGGIVLDLQNYAAECEDEPDEVLRPLVQNWYDRQRQKGGGE